MLRGGATAAYVGESLFDLLTRTALSREAHYELRDLAAQQGHPLPVDAVFARSGRLSRDARRAGVQDRIGRADEPAAAAAHRAEGQADDRVDGHVDARGDRRARSACSRRRARTFALMHCTSTYPTPFEHVQLGCIGVAAAEVQRARRLLGSHARQRRWRWRRSRAARTSSRSTSRRRARCPGPISRARWSRPNSRSSCKGIRAIEQARGATKMIQPGEQDVRNMALHSVVSIRDIAAGATIGAADVWAKRPGTGIPARQLGEVIGRMAKRAIPRDRLIAWDDSEVRARSDLNSPRLVHGARRFERAAGQEPPAARRQAAHRLHDRGRARVGRARSTHALHRRPRHRRGGTCARLRRPVHAAAPNSRATRRRTCRSCSTPCGGCDEHEGYRPDAVMILQPTSPLRQPEHIRESVALLERSGADSVVERLRGAGSLPPDAHDLRSIRPASPRCS